MKKFIQTLLVASLYLSASAYADVDKTALKKMLMERMPLSSLKKAILALLQ